MRETIKIACWDCLNLVDPATLTLYERNYHSYIELCTKCMDIIKRRQNNVWQ